jgi:hypothetical protein
MQNVLMDLFMEQFEVRKYSKENKESSCFQLTTIYERQ